MERMAEEYTQELYSMPEGALDGLMRCAIVALGLQERYSVVAACKFVVRDIWRVSFSILIALISARNIPSDMHQGCAFAGLVKSSTGETALGPTRGTIHQL